MFIFFLLSTICIIYSQGESTLNNKKCNYNEIYECSLFHQETCDYKPEIDVNEKCTFGCYCQVGYIRLSNATDSPCIKRHECPSKDVIERTMPACGENEEHHECGPSCPPRCKDLLYPHKNTECTAQCVPGCYCKQGLYRNEDGKCIKPEECCTDENEHYKECGTHCPEFCHSGVRICNKQCVPGCFCKTNFIRKDNSTISSCIERNKC